MGDEGTGFASGGAITLGQSAHQSKLFYKMSPIASGTMGNPMPGKQVLAVRRTSLLV
ncbi:hypothetical protein ACFTZB_23250 [Rhodococcus sp. NPDC057014]|uniref:hypothetical protein n=1 Tax=Rhodococcus sp. NPDC057014 TaxID=3346000 RepID=UPI00362FF089